MPRPATTSNLVGGPRRWLILGHAGSGKSPLALSYPGKLVVAACDNKDVWCPKPADQYEFVDYANAADPYTCLKDALTYDWRSEGYSAIVIDTMTSVANHYLDAAINSGAYGAKAVTFGSNTFKLGDKPHYGLVHNLVGKTLELVKECPLDVITVWHAAKDDEEGGVHGPLSVNLNRANQIMREFANILFTRTANENGKTAFYCHAAPYGAWPARVVGPPSTNPVIQMTADPSVVWEKLGVK